MKPTLSQVLISLFTMLGLIEGLFIGVLCNDIMKADRAAKREFNIVKASQDVSSTIEMYHQATMNTWYTDPWSVAERPKLRLKLEQILNTTCQEFVELGESFNSMTRMKTSINTSFQSLEEHRLSKLNGTEDEKKQARLANYKSCYQCIREFLRILHRMNKLIHQPSEPPFLGIAPVQLLYAAAGINVLFLLGVGTCVRLGITRPVSRLAHGCERIKQGLPLEKSPVLSSELDSLQESFYLMSRQIIENEQRRKSYIALLQTVQLAVISRVCERLADFSRVSTVAEKARKKLETATTNLANLINLLESMTTALAGGGQQDVELNLSSCSSNRLLQDVYTSVEALLQERKISLNFDGADYLIELDAALIRRVLLNLVSNAIKYSPDGKSVTVSVVSDAKNIRFNVQDQGPGISAEGKAKLFQRYSQLKALDGVKRAGTGLGLVICKELVEAHHGEIGCESTPGSGSCFWFSLPAKASVTQGQTNAQQEKMPAIKEPRLAARAKTGSMILGLVSTLLLFLVIQSFLFVQLNSMLNNLTKKAATYAVQIDKLMTTQELFARQSLWGQQMQIIATKRDIAAAPAALKFLTRLKSDLSSLYSPVEAKNEIVEIDTILKGETELIEVMKYGISNVNEVLSDLDGLQKRVDSIAKKIEDSYFRLFDLQRAGFNASYDWSQQLRSQMLTVLIIAAAADLFVIVAALLAGISIARRITLLKSKALDFSAAKPISPSLKGKDELTFLDQRLCEVSEDIRKAEAQRQELMAVINHDLRTPLASVLSVLESLSVGVYGALPERGLAIVGESDQELQHLLLQINDLLTLEKIDSGAYDLSVQNLRVDQMLKESQESISEAAAARNVSITISSEAEVSQLELRGDKQLLVRLCAIVLKNAIENSAANTSLKLNLRKSSNKIIMDVEDCGKGINPDLLPVIFQRFRFVDGKPIGGLGLPLAFRVCQMHEGEIAIKHSGPDGTIVGISLPLAA